MTVGAAYQAGDDVAARFRLYASNPSGADYSGGVSNGEVEDYLWTFDVPASPPSLSVSGGTLSWTPSAANCGYEVWEDSLPYRPLEDGALKATLPAESSGYSIEYAMDTPATSYYFVVRALGCGGDTAVSNDFGVFNFAVSPGE